MELTARVTQNAKVKKLTDGRSLVEFSVVINDYYKPKGEEKSIQTSLFINCAYWLNTTISSKITKGVIVELNGRLQVNAYNSMGEARASRNCHVNSIKIHGGGKKEETPTAPTPQDDTGDLPF